MKKNFKKNWRSIGILILVVIVSLPAWYWIRTLLKPGPPEPTESAKQYARQVTILRDRWGIPHIFGRTDNAAAFGLAYAHAEDDFPLIQASLVASRGKLALLHLSKLSLINDYMVQFLNCRNNSSGNTLNYHRSSDRFLMHMRRGSIILPTTTRMRLTVGFSRCRAKTSSPGLFINCP